jgi:hypothetical protein
MHFSLAQRASMTPFFHFAIGGHGWRGVRAAISPAQRSSRQLGGQETERSTAKRRTTTVRG